MKKETYRKRVESQLKEWDAKIAQLRKDMEGKEEEVKKSSLEELDEIKRQKEIVSKHLERLKSNHDDDWKNIKMRIDLLSEEIKNRFGDSALK